METSRTNSRRESDSVQKLPPSRFYTGTIEFLLSQSGERLTVLVPSEIPELHVFSAISVQNGVPCLEASDGRVRPCYALADAIDGMNEIRVAVLVSVSSRGPDLARILTIRRAQNVAGKSSGIDASSMA